jgi:hypothetical protein
MQHQCLSYVMTVEKDTLVNVLDFICINYLIRVQEANYFLLLRLVNVTYIIALLVLDDPSKFLVFIVNIVLIGNFLVSLLS